MTLHAVTRASETTLTLTAGDSSKSAESGKFRPHKVWLLSRIHAKVTQCILCYLPPGLILRGCVEKVVNRAGKAALLPGITESIMTGSVLPRQSVLLIAKPTMSPQKHHDRSPQQQDSVCYCLLFRDKSVSVSDVTPRSSSSSRSSLDMSSVRDWLNG